MGTKSKYFIDIELDDNDRRRINNIRYDILAGKHGNGWNWNNFVSTSLKVFNEMLNSNISGEQYRAFLKHPNLCQDFEEKQKDSHKFDSVSLGEIIGLNNIKNKIKRLANLMKKAFWVKSSMNYVFIGNPGTGKTMMARALAHEFYKEKIIQSEKLVEVDRTDLIAEYVGQTAPKVKKCFERAIGGVLFIDEAYSICCGKWGDDYSNEALSEINKLMEDYKGQLVVIFSGYKKETIDMLDKNPGLRSRINNIFEFYDYTNEELRQILNKMSSKQLFEFEKEAADKVIQIVTSKKYSKYYGNARDIRNVFEGILEFWALREIEYKEWNTIKLEDVINWQIENKVVIREDIIDA